MKLEPVVATSEKAGGGPGGAATTRITLERGDLAGRTFAALLDVCPNPCCACQDVRFNCEPPFEPEATTTLSSDGRAPVRFDLDVFERRVNARTDSSPEGLALGRAVAAELEPEQWDWLKSYFVASKRRRMSTLDLDTIEVVLPPEVMSGRGSMLGYFEVFPWAEPFEFSHGGNHWIADDQYCIEPGCGCTTTVLSFVRLPSDTAPGHLPLSGDAFVRYDYVGDQVEVVDTKPGSPAPDRLVEGLRAAFPSFRETVRERHHQLKRLGERFRSGKRRRKRAPVPAAVEDASAEEPGPLQPPRPVTRPPKIGRNDPCPCGSGKKYKKCCGA